MTVFPVCVCVWHLILSHTCFLICIQSLGSAYDCFTGWNFAGKVRTSLKLWSMTTKCLQYAVWHIINNSSVALDGAQPKESMNSPWLHPAVPFGKTPVGYCPGPGFWMFISLTSCAYPIVYFFQLYKAFKCLYFQLLFRIGGVRWMQNECKKMKNFSIDWLSAWLDEFIKKHRQDCRKFRVFCVGERWKIHSVRKHQGF